MKIVIFKQLKFAIYCIPRRVFVMWFFFFIFQLGHNVTLRTSLVGTVSLTVVVRMAKIVTR